MLCRASRLLRTAHQLPTPPRAQGPTVTCTYRDLHRRAKLCALALRALGVG